MKSRFLADMSWMEARRWLTPQALVLLPLGAAAKEHGPHLKLDNDRRLAEHLARRVAEKTEVVVAPTLAYHYYPAFVAYAGSTSLRLETARDLVVDVVDSLAAFGPCRFYVLNTGVSTVRALEPAAAVLAGRGILLRFSRVERAGSAVVRRLQQQAFGSHADEIETSMMLHLEPQSVDMSLAARDGHPGSGRLSPEAGGGGIYSPTGIYGDATFATAAKGEAIVGAMVDDMLAEIAALRAAALPERGA